jgi:hypothetical protein
MKIANLHVVASVGSDWTARFEPKDDIKNGMARKLLRIGGGGRARATVDNDGDGHVSAEELQNFMVEVSKEDTEIGSGISVYFTTSKQDDRYALSDGEVVKIILDTSSQTLSFEVNGIRKPEAYQVEGPVSLAVSCHAHGQAEILDASFAQASLAWDSCKTVVYVDESGNSFGAWSVRDGGTGSPNRVAELKGCVDSHGTSQYGVAVARSQFPCNDGEHWVTVKFTSTTGLKFNDASTPGQPQGFSCGVITSFAEFLDFQQAGRSKPFESDEDLVTGLAWDKSRGKGCLGSCPHGWALYRDGDTAHNGVWKSGAKFLPTKSGMRRIKKPDGQFIDSPSLHEMECLISSGNNPSPLGPANYMLAPIAVKLKISMKLASKSKDGKADHTNMPRYEAVLAINELAARVPKEAFGTFVKLGYWMSDAVRRQRYASYRPLERPASRFVKTVPRQRAVTAGGEPVQYERTLSCESPWAKILQRLRRQADHSAAGNFDYAPAIGDTVLVMASGMHRGETGVVRGLHGESVAVSGNTVATETEFSSSELHPADGPTSAAEWWKFAMVCICHDRRSILGGRSSWIELQAATKPRFVYSVVRGCRLVGRSFLANDYVSLFKRKLAHDARLEHLGASAWLAKPSENELAEMERIEDQLPIECTQLYRKAALHKLATECQERNKGNASHQMQLSQLALATGGNYLRKAIQISAGESGRTEISVKPGHTFYAFQVDKSRDIKLSVRFYPNRQGGPPRVTDTMLQSDVHHRVNRGAGCIELNTGLHRVSEGQEEVTQAIKEDGTLVLSFDNSYSWFNEKNVVVEAVVQHEGHVTAAPELELELEPAPQSKAVAKCVDDFVAAVDVAIQRGSLTLSSVADDLAKIEFSDFKVTAKQRETASGAKLNISLNLDKLRLEDCVAARDPKILFANIVDVIKNPNNNPKTLDNLSDQLRTMLKADHFMSVDVTKDDFTSGGQSTTHLGIGLALQALQLNFYKPFVDSLSTFFVLDDDTAAALHDASKAAAGQLGKMRREAATAAMTAESIESAAATVINFGAVLYAPKILVPNDTARKKVSAIDLGKIELSYKPPPKHKFSDSHQEYMLHITSDPMALVKGELCVDKPPKMKHSPASWFTVNGTRFDAAGEVMRLLDDSRLEADIMQSKRPFDPTVNPRVGFVGRLDGVHLTISNDRILFLTTMAADLGQTADFNELSNGPRTSTLKYAPYYLPEPDLVISYQTVPPKPLYIPAVADEAWGSSSEFSETSDDDDFEDAVEYEARIDVRELYARIDTNQDGTLTHDEIVKGFKKMGITLNSREVKEVYQLIDKDESGEVDFEEFETWISSREHTAGRLTRHLLNPEKEAQKDKRYNVKWFQQGRHYTFTHEADFVDKDEHSQREVEQALLIRLQKEYPELGVEMNDVSEAHRRQALDDAHGHVGHAMARLVHGSFTYEGSQVTIDALPIGVDPFAYWDTVLSSLEHVTALSQRGVSPFTLTAQEEFDPERLLLQAATMKQLRERLTVAEESTALAKQKSIFMPRKDVTDIELENWIQTELKFEIGELQLSVYNSRADVVKDRLLAITLSKFELTVKASIYSQEILVQAEEFTIKDLRRKKMHRLDAECFMLSTRSREATPDLNAVRQPTMKMLYKTQTVHPSEFNGAAAQQKSTVDLYLQCLAVALDMDSLLWVEDLQKDTQAPSSSSLEAQTPPDAANMQIRSESVRRRSDQPGAGMLDYSSDEETLATPVSRRKTGTRAIRPEMECRVEIHGTEKQFELSCRSCDKIAAIKSKICDRAMVYADEHRLILDVHGNFSVGNDNKTLGDYTNGEATLHLLPDNAGMQIKFKVSQCVHIEWIRSMHLAMKKAEMDCKHAIRKELELTQIKEFEPGYLQLEVGTLFVYLTADEPGAIYDKPQPEVETEVENSPVVDPESFMFTKSQGRRKPKSFIKKEKKQLDHITRLAKSHKIQADVLMGMGNLRWFNEQSGLQMISNATTSELDVVQHRPPRALDAKPIEIDLSMSAGKTEVVGGLAGWRIVGLTDFLAEVSTFIDLRSAQPGGGTAKQPASPPSAPTEVHALQSDKPAPVGTDKSIFEKFPIKIDFGDMAIVLPWPEADGADKKSSSGAVMKMGRFRADSSKVGVHDEMDEECFLMGGICIAVYTKPSDYQYIFEPISFDIHRDERLVDIRLLTNPKLRVSLNTISMFQLLSTTITDSLPMSQSSTEAPPPVAEMHPAKHDMGTAIEIASRRTHTIVSVAGRETDGLAPTFTILVLNDCNDSLRRQHFLKIETTIQDLRCGFLASMELQNFQTSIEMKIQGYESGSHTWASILEPCTLNVQQRPQNIDVQIPQLDFTVSDSFLAELQNTLAVFGQKVQLRSPTFQVRNETGLELHLSSHEHVHCDDADDWIVLDNDGDGQTKDVHELVPYCFKKLQAQTGFDSPLNEQIKKAKRVTKSHLKQILKEVKFSGILPEEETDKFIHYMPLHDARDKKVEIQEFLDWWAGQEGFDFIAAENVPRLHIWLAGSLTQVKPTCTESEYVCVSRCKILKSRARDAKVVGQLEENTTIVVEEIVQEDLGSGSEGLALSWMRITNPQPGWVAEMDSWVTPTVQRSLYKSGKFAANWRCNRGAQYPVVFSITSVAGCTEMVAGGTWRIQNKTGYKFTAKLLQRPRDPGGQPEEYWRNTIGPHVTAWEALSHEQRAAAHMLGSDVKTWPRCESWEKMGANAKWENLREDQQLAAKTLGWDEYNLPPRASSRSSTSLPLVVGSDGFKFDDSRVQLCQDFEHDWSEKDKEWPTLEMLRSSTEHSTAKDGATVAYFKLGNEAEQTWVCLHCTFETLVGKNNIKLYTINVVPAVSIICLIPMEVTCQFVCPGEAVRGKSAQKTLTLRASSEMPVDFTMLNLGDETEPVHLHILTIGEGLYQKDNRKGKCNFPCIFPARNASAAVSHIVLRQNTQASDSSTYAATHARRPLVLQLHREVKNGTAIIHIVAPILAINSSGLSLLYGSTNQESHSQAANPDERFTCSSLAKPELADLSSRVGSSLSKRTRRRSRRKVNTEIVIQTPDRPSSQESWKDFVVASDFECLEVCLYSLRTSSPKKIAITNVKAKQDNMIIKVADGQASRLESKPFSVPTAGGVSAVEICAPNKSNQGNKQLGFVAQSMGHSASDAAVTQVLRFYPRYIFVNGLAEHGIELFQELPGKRSNAEATRVACVDNLSSDHPQHVGAIGSSGEKSIHFPVESGTFPDASEHRLCIRLLQEDGSELQTVTSHGFRVDQETRFPMEVSDGSNGSKMILVDIGLYEATFYIRVSEEPEDRPTYRMTNHSDLNVSIWQKADSEQAKLLVSVDPNQSVPFAWTGALDPSEQVLVIRIHDSSDETRDEQFEIGNDCDINFQKPGRMPITRADIRKAIEVDGHTITLRVTNPNIGSTPEDIEAAQVKRDSCRVRVEGCKKSCREKTGAEKRAAEKELVRAEALYHLAKLSVRNARQLQKHLAARSPSEKVEEFLYNFEPIGIANWRALQRSTWFWADGAPASVSSKPQQEHWHWLEHYDGWQLVRDEGCDVDGWLYNSACCIGPTGIKSISTRSRQRKFKRWRVRTGIAMESKLTLNVESFGFSLAQRMSWGLLDILYVSIFDVALVKRDTSTRTSLELLVESFQIDNAGYGCYFPVVIQPEFATAGRKALHVSIVQDTSDSIAGNLTRYEYFSMLLQSVDINVELGLIKAMLDFHASMTRQMAVSMEVADTFAWRQLIENEKLRAVQIVELLKTDGLPEALTYFRSMNLQPLQFNLSVHIEGSLTATLGIAADGNTTLDLVINTLSGIQDGELCFTGLAFDHMLTDSTALRKKLMEHYTASLMSQALKVGASLEVFGNPKGLWDNVSQGVKIFFHEPAQGLVQSPENFVTGAAKGVAGLLKNVVGGVFDTAQSVTGAVSRGLQTLDFNENEQSSRSEPQTILQGLAYAFADILEGIWEGISGVMSQPIEGAFRAETLLGLLYYFVIGLVKGAIGFVVRPVHGIVQAATDLAAGIKNNVRGLHVGDDTMMLAEQAHSRVRNPNCTSGGGAGLGSHQPLSDGGGASGQDQAYNAAAAWALKRMLSLDNYESSVAPEVLISYTPLPPVQAPEGGVHKHSHSANSSSTPSDPSDPSLDEHTTARMKLLTKAANLFSVEHQGPTVLLITSMPAEQQYSGSGAGHLILAPADLSETAIPSIPTESKPYWSIELCGPREYITSARAVDSGATWDQLEDGRGHEIEIVYLVSTSQGFDSVGREKVGLNEQNRREAEGRVSWPERKHFISCGGPQQTAEILDELTRLTDLPHDNAEETLSDASRPEFSAAGLRTWRRSAGRDQWIVEIHGCEVATSGRASTIAAPRP